MFASGIGRALARAAGMVLLAVSLLPGVAASQDDLDRFVARERELIESIDREESLNGPYSEALISPLTALSLHFEEAGDVGQTDALIARVLQVIRANYGLYSLEQAPSIRRLIAREEARGNAAAAWSLERELLVLASRHFDDIRSARIFRDTGDRRMEILKRYDTGEIPPEIVLGCYYNDAGEHLRARLRGSRPIDAYPGTQLADGCQVGSRTRARRALVLEAQSLYAGAVDVYLRSEQSLDDELRDLLIELVRNAYIYGNPGLASQSLRQLYDLETEISTEWLPRIEAFVHMADWELLYSPLLGTRYRDSALAAYEQAYEWLDEHQVAQESIDAMFSPEIPVVLPSFLANPLASAETPESKGFIDVAFVIARDGKSRRVEVLGRADNVTRADERELVRTIRNSRFRPRLTEGQFADAAPVTLRYFVND
jgi:hypothetical protein